jgi:hypothetical protein
MNLSKEVRVLSALLLIITILFLGTIALNFQKDLRLNQMANTYTQSLKTIETYCDINITEINEQIRQEQLEQLYAGNLVAID